jgi:hypothetical protein
MDLVWEGVEDTIYKLQNLAAFKSSVGKTTNQDNTRS